MKCVSIWAIALAATLSIACADNNDTVTDDTAISGGTAARPDDAAGTTGADRPGTMASAADERRFVEDMGAKGVAEVKLGQLAADRATNPEVKKFGQQMVADHSKANDELKKVASEMNIQLPSQPDDEHQELLDRLSKLKGAEFDREFMQAMVDGHEEVADELERHAGTARTGERGVGTTGAAGEASVSAWAAKTLPTVRQHLDQAKQINDKLIS